MLGKTQQRFAKVNCEEPGGRKNPSKSALRLLNQSLSSYFTLKKPNQKLQPMHYGWFMHGKLHQGSVCRPNPAQHICNFDKYCFLGTKPCPFIYMLYTVAFPLQWQLLVAAENLGPPKIFTFFTEKVPCLLSYMKQSVKS